eukprot:m.1007951 g.1007951  ORF g.1007951 m.1007951 type:complete len:57 (+) comp24057_c0_seq37:2344-2514(+)
MWYRSASVCLDLIVVMAAIPKACIHPNESLCLVGSSRKIYQGCCVYLFAPTVVRRV